MSDGSLRGIHPIAVPTAFPVGDVNAYLVEGDPLTLIDSGPNSATSLLALERGIAATGHRIEDLELLLVTHQHGDHLGLTEALVDRSGAEVACLAAMVPYAGNFLHFAGLDDDLALDLMVTHGVGRETALGVRAQMAFVRHFGVSFEVEQALQPGDVIDVGGRSLRVLLRPGHSPSDTVFVDEHAGIAFGGDHLLWRTSSVATISCPLDDTTAFDAGKNRPHALSIYIESLKETQLLEFATVLPGHGPVFDDSSTLIENRLAFHHERAAAVLAILGEAPASAHQIAIRLFKTVSSTQPSLTMFEVLGHLDLLVEQDLVSEHEDEGRVLFRLSGGATA